MGGREDGRGRERSRERSRSRSRERERGRGRERGQKREKGGGTQTHRHTDTQTHRHTDTQTRVYKHKHPFLPLLFCNRRWLCRSGCTCSGLTTSWADLVRCTVTVGEGRDSKRVCVCVFGPIRVLAVHWSWKKASERETRSPHAISHPRPPALIVRLQQCNAFEPASRNQSGVCLYRSGHCQQRLCVDPTCRLLCLPLPLPAHLRCLICQLPSLPPPICFPCVILAQELLWVEENDRKASNTYAQHGAAQQQNEKESSSEHAQQQISHATPIKSERARANKATRRVIVSSCHCVVVSLCRCFVGVSIALVWVLARVVEHRVERRLDIGDVVAQPGRSRGRGRRGKGVRLLVKAQGSQTHTHTHHHTPPPPPGMSVRALLCVCVVEFLPQRKDICRRLALDLFLPLLQSLKRCKNRQTSGAGSLGC